MGLTNKTIRVSFVLLLTLGFLLSGCSSVGELKSRVTSSIFGREDPNPPEPLEQISITQNVRLLWQYEVGEAGDFEFSPQYLDGFVYAASTEGGIHKIDEASGEAAWSIKVEEMISGGVGVGGNLVMVGSQRGTLYAYTTDGQPVWKSHLSSEILSTPVYFDGLVIVRTGDSKIYGIDATDGSRRWVYNRRGPALTLRSSAGVVVDGGAVYAGFAGGKLIALRADNGKLLWETVVAQPKGVTEIERIADITSVPVIDGGIVYAVAYQGKVAAVDRLSGRIVWSRLLSSLNGLAVADSRIYVSQSQGSLYSLGEEKGKSYWRQANLKNRQLSQPLPMGKVIAVGDVEGYVHLIDTDEGAFVGRAQLDKSPIMPTMKQLNATTMVLQNRQGQLYAIALEQ